jgi:SAM-dependent methyltransferase
MSNELAVSKELWEAKQRRLEEWRKANPSNDGSFWYQQILGSIAFGQGAKVLDVGAMEGRMRECFPVYVDYMGIDPKPGGSVIRGVAEALPFEDGAFDFVTCFASLFHFMDLKKSFSEMSRVLKKGGQLLILVILKGPRDMDSESHTFRLNWEMINGLADEARLILIGKERISDLDSWLYRWIK